jgi:hypothetical protein
MEPSRPVRSPFTIKHITKVVFYAQPHGYPLFFTIRHTKFTVRHMPRCGKELRGKELRGQKPGVE